MAKKIYTANTSRDTLGVGSILSTNHEGVTNPRPTERNPRLDDWTPKTKKTIADFFKRKNAIPLVAADETDEGISEGAQPGS